MDWTAQSEAVHERFRLAAQDAKLTKIAREVTQPLADQIVPIVRAHLPWVEEDFIRLSIVRGWFVAFADAPTRPGQTNIHTTLTLNQVVSATNEALSKPAGRPVDWEPEVRERHRIAGWVIRYLVCAGYEMGREPDSGRTDFSALLALLNPEPYVPRARPRGLLDLLLGR